MLHASLHILTKVYGVLRCHAELQEHHQDVVTGEIGTLWRDDGLDDSFLQHPLYFASLNGVSSESVELPAVEHLDDSREEIFDHLLIFISFTGLLR
ncbi:hypothetical protein AUJ46_01060 [Candidatus Peregrinibacteria bacterium CG1_02_54_53]|nr:MAG: hypothetical protein AUJ46_01060 [Candidatus Peregrinibacteria bacterium CG1_02_54_53]